MTDNNKPTTPPQKTGGTLSLGGGTLSVNRPAGQTGGFAKPGVTVEVRRRRFDEPTPPPTAAQSAPAPASNAPTASAWPSQPPLPPKPETPTAPVASSTAPVVPEKKATLTAPAAAAPKPAAPQKPLDPEMARRMQILEQARANADVEQQRRAVERAQASSLMTFRQQQLEEERKKREQEEQERQQRAAAAAAPRALPGMRTMGERSVSQLRTTAQTPAARQNSDAPRKILTVDESKRAAGSGKPSSRDLSSKRGRNAYMEDLEQIYRTQGPSGRRRRGAKQDRMDQNDSRNPAEKVLREVIIPEFITVQELASRMSEKASDVVKKMLLMGQMVTLTETIDQETAALIAGEMGHTYKLTKETDIEEGMSEAPDDPDSLQTRAPVVTVMGHVDHGKTSLLDALRKTDVAAGEAGGITQHIGAYQITSKSGRRITFLDTPGHAAFTQLRARGAKVTDVVILVVAADDGVMPQTIEAITHAKAAKVPLVVAINKMDKPGADPRRVKEELLKHELVAEEFGGEVVMVPISAKTGIGLEQLEEMVLLQADVLDLKANPNRRAEGTIIESKLDKGRGPVATVIVQKGTLNVGDIVVAGAVWGRVRALMNDKGERVEQALPAAPIEILGLQGVPEAGDEFMAVADEKQAREVASFREQKLREKSQASKKLTLEGFFGKMETGDMKELPVIIKADVQGSVEAVTHSLAQLNNDMLKVRAIQASVGVVTESDVMLAAAGKALILAFNVRADAQARKIAERDGVEIRYYTIIYNLIDDVKAAMGGLLSPELREETLGQAQVRQIFKIGKIKIAGCMVLDGLLRRGAKARVIRDGVVILNETSFSSLKRLKDDAKEVKQGFDCGFTLANFDDWKEGDIVECFETKHITRSFEDAQKAAAAMVAEKAKSASAS